MAFIETLAPEAAQEAVLQMYLRQQTAWGYLPNYAKVFCHRPQVMARWGQLLAEIFDMAAAAAGRAFFTKLLDALGVLPDSPFLAKGEAFRRTLTLGRAIDEHECVTLPITPGQTPWESG